MAMIAMPIRASLDFELEDEQEGVRRDNSTYWMANG
jgi:hypothetical protein